MLDIERENILKKVKPKAPEKISNKISVNSESQERKSFS